MGIGSRCVLYAEREAYPVSVLEARMEEGSLDAAPIWLGDFTKLPAKEFRGVVDIVIAGFPCQDLSVAGRRAGLDGARSGLFFEVVRVAVDCGAQFMFLENVAGIASASATVVDETEGELDERAASRVLGELADCGWDAEWVTISASDVGASHGRARWFCFAWRMANSEGERGIFRKWNEFQRGTKIKSSINSMGDAQSIRPNWTADEQCRTTSLGCSGEYVADTESIGNGSGSFPVGIESQQSITSGYSSFMADSDGSGLRTSGKFKFPSYDIASIDKDLADTSGEGLQKRTGGG